MKHLWRAVAGVIACATVLTLVIWSCFEYGQFDHSNTPECPSRKRIAQDGFNDYIEIPHGFNGDQDIYGMGTRIGVYLQWSASLIATIFLNRERTRLTAAFICFEIATLAAFFFLIFNDACIFSMECLILVYFLFGGIAAVLGPDLIAGVIGYRNADELTVQDVVVMLLVCVVSTVTSWFWIRFAWVGDDVDFAATPGGTSLFIFCHARGQEIQRASIFMAIVCVQLAVCTFDKILGLVITKVLELPQEPPSFVLASLVIAIASIFRWLGLSAANPLWLTALVDWACLSLPWQESWSQTSWSSSLQHWIEELCPEWGHGRNRGGGPTTGRNATDELNELTGIKKAMTDYGNLVKLTSVAFCSVAFAFGTTGIELTLSWNYVRDIDDVLSAGQIVPLTGGIIVLFTALWHTFTETNKVQEENKIPLSPRTQHCDSEETHSAHDERTSGAEIVPHSAQPARRRSTGLSLTQSQ